MLDWQKMVEDGEAEMVAGVLYKNRVEVGRITEKGFVEHDGALEQAEAAPAVEADTTATLNTAQSRANEAPAAPEPLAPEPAPEVVAAPVAEQPADPQPAPEVEQAPNDPAAAPSTPEV